MVRLREIDDVSLREELRELIAASRGMMPCSIPDWWEMDDADLSEMLIELRWKKENPNAVEPSAVESNAVEHDQ